MGADAAVGGGGASLLDLELVAEQFGAALAPIPLVEGLVTGRLLATAGESVRPVFEHLCDEPPSVATLALHPTPDGVARLVPAGAVATRDRRAGRRRPRGRRDRTAERRRGAQPGRRRDRQPVPPRRHPVRRREWRRRARAPRARGRRVAGAHGGRAGRPGRHRARARGRVREAAAPVRRADRIVPVDRARPGRRRHRGGRRADPRARGRRGPPTKPRRTRPRWRGCRSCSRRAPRSRRPRPRCTCTAATGSPSSTTSSSTTGARKAWPLLLGDPRRGALNLADALFGPPETATKVER